MKNYKERIADAILKEKLSFMGAVLIIGPKWCGKTTTAEQIAKSVLYIDDPDSKKQTKELAAIRPSVLLQGETPRLLDEWQQTPELWDAVRYEVDHRENNIGQFILTGSAVPLDKDDKMKISHSGTGRIARLTMYPMSLAESGESNGKVSLENDLFTDNQNVFATNELSLDDIAYLICRGGWPGTLSLSPNLAIKISKEYVDAIANVDISRVDDTQRNPEFTKRLLRSYARNQGAQVPISTIYSDIINNDHESLEEASITSYINALKKLFVIEDVKSWNPNLRSKTAIRTSDTRYFIDPSIATAVLGVEPNDLTNDLNTMGLLFETLVIRDLRVYADAIDGTLYHYRDKSGLECDAVIHLRNGKYGLIEIKLGGEKNIEDGAITLKKLQNKIDTDKMFKPSFMAVITAVGKYAYRREDGIYIVPIGCLKN